MGVFTGVLSANLNASIDVASKYESSWSHSNSVGSLTLVHTVHTNVAAIHRVNFTDPEQRTEQWITVASFFLTDIKSSSSYYDHMYCHMTITWLSHDCHMTVTACHMTTTACFMFLDLLASNPDIPFQICTTLDFSPEQKASYRPSVYLNIENLSLWW